MMGQPSSWLQLQQGLAAQPSEGPTTKLESEARATKRAIKKKMEERVDARCNQGRKPHFVRVKASGSINGGCKGKNEYENIATLANLPQFPWSFSIHERYPFAFRHPNG